MWYAVTRKKEKDDNPNQTPLQLPSSSPRKLEVLLGWNTAGDLRNLKKPVDKIATLAHSLSMKEKTPQKAQLWAVGNKVYRVIKTEGDKTHVHHHGEMALFYTRHLKMATPSQIAEYLGK